MVIPFNSNEIEYEIIGTILRDELTALNSRFQIEVRSVPSNEYYDSLRGHRLPLFFGSWLEDIHDPHNWLFPYVIGTYARFQGLPPDLQRQFEDFVKRGVSASDPDQRAVIYQGFNQLYYEQAPAILLFSSVNRRYQQRWVNGWYDNAIYPGIYFYALSKD
jgi:peptide/nickel transport system substrate-binding protein